MATPAVKQNSDDTNLRIAEEDTVGVLPGTPNWVQYEPNSYSDFGGNYTKVARNPINDSRQRGKGELTGLEAAGGFNTDLTQTNLADIFQGLMFADFRRKGEESPTNVDGTANEYDVASTSGFFVGSLVFADGFEEAVNEGLKRVTAFTLNTSLAVSDTGLVDETPPDDASLVVVGHQFGSGTISVDVTGDLPKYVQGSLVAATGTLTATGNPADGATVTIGTTVYTFETGALDAAYKVLVGATASDSLDNLIAAINGAAGEGSLYATGTVAHTQVTAAAGAGDTMDVTAIVPGANGNKIATTETSGDLSWGNTTLTGGTGESFVALGLIPGETIFVGGDQTAEEFSDAEDNGFKRVRSVTDSEIEIDKSDETMVVNAGGGKTIQFFFGRCLKNEARSLIVRRSYQLERTLGAPDLDLPDDVQVEYLVGSVLNTCAVNIPQEDKVTCDLAFLSIDHEPTDATDGLKDGDRPELTDADAFNTSTDFSRLKIAQVVAGSEAPSPLVAYLSSLTINVNNNASIDKAVAVLGGFDFTVGQFTVGGSLEGYFADIASVQSIRDNADVTLDFVLVRNNAGIALDLPLCALGNGRLNVVQNQAIKIPLDMEAARGRKIDADLDHTAFWVFFDYLPDAADLNS